MQEYQEHRAHMRQHDLERMEQPFLDDEPTDSLKPLDY